MIRMYVFDNLFEIFMITKYTIKRVRSQFEIWREKKFKKNKQKIVLDIKRLNIYKN